MPAAPASFYALWLLNKLFNSWCYQKMLLIEKLQGPNISLIRTASERSELRAKRAAHEVSEAVL